MTDINNELLRIQRPVAVQIQSLVSLLELIKDEMPENMFNIFLDSVKSNVTNSLDSLKTVQLSSDTESFMQNIIDKAKEQGIEPRTEMDPNQVNSFIQSMANDSDIVSCHGSGPSNVMLDKDGNIVQI